jgi:2-polyprenyl-6-hydroxyphenyl methylase/3-demethylubiquinone-9 3-methyltransferase
VEPNAAMLAYSLAIMRPSRHLRSWPQHRSCGGMSKLHDIVDWIGGYPFEVTKPEENVFYFKDRGFDLIGTTTCAGETGCNEYVSRKEGVRTFTPAN